LCAKEKLFEEGLKTLIKPEVIGFAGFFIADFESPDRFLLAGWGFGW
jgi:hypothetical protein